MGFRGRDNDLSARPAGRLIFMTTQPKQPYQHPKSISDFEKVYKKEYERELESCDGWIKWCQGQTPTDNYGVNFYQGMRSAHVFNNIKMGQIIRILKGEPPNL